MSRADTLRRLRVPLERLEGPVPQREWRTDVSAAELLVAVDGDDPGVLSVGDVAVDEGRRIAVDVELDRVAEGVVVTGSIDASYVAPCSRCLRTVSAAITADVRELFRPVPDDDDYPLGEDTLDLAPLVRDAVLLELPLVAVCENDDDCEYEPPVDDEPDDRRDPRWAALDALRSDDDA